MTQLSYGEFDHDENETNFSITRQGIESGDGIVWGFREIWSVDGVLHGDTNAELNIAREALEAAYAIQGQDLILKKGSDTMHSLINSNSLSGVRVTSPPQFGVKASGELTTFRTYSLVVEADYALSNMTYSLADGTTPSSNSEVVLLKYEESIEYKGTGGPRFALLPTIKGTYQKQQLTETSPVEATQSGMAIGLGKCPLPATPIWPDDEHIERRIIRKPQARKRGGYQIEYPIHWSYIFERNIPYL